MNHNTMLGLNIIIVLLHCVAVKETTIIIWHIIMAYNAAE